MPNSLSAVADTGIAAALCTNRPAEAVRPALEALAASAAAAGDERVIVVTSGLSGEELEAHRGQAAELGAELVPEPEPGISRARNAALEALDGEDVIAYIDDDVIVEPDWLERVSAHWSEADPEVACIGGAILPRFAHPPPRWLGPSLHGALSLLDRGEQTEEVEPGTVWSANISFRRAALQEVDGFDTAIGPHGKILLFGEESELQRRLAARGHRILYAGDVRADHCIGPERLRLRGMLRRRFFFGVSTGIARQESPLAGAGRALKATAGLAIAAARGNAPLAGERVARLATNCGLAATPLVRARLRKRGWPGR